MELIQHEQGQASKQGEASFGVVIKYLNIKYILYTTYKNLY